MTGCGRHLNAGTAPAAATRVDKNTEEKLGRERRGEQSSGLWKSLTDRDKRKKTKGKREKNSEQPGKQNPTEEVSLTRRCSTILTKGTRTEKTSLEMQRAPRNSLVLCELQESLSHPVM